jgi:amino acid permease
MCSASPHSLSRVEWFLAILIAQLPLSLIVHSFGHFLLVSQETAVVKISDILNAIGIIVLAFRGHNLVLEIQVCNNVTL